MCHKDHIAFTLQKEMCSVYLYTPGIVFKVVQNKRNKRNWIDQDSVLKVFLANYLLSFSGMGCCTLHTHVEGNISWFHYVMAICRNHILLLSDLTQFTFNVNAHNNRVWRLQYSPKGITLSVSPHHKILGGEVQYMFMIASTILCNEKHMIPQMLC